MILRNMLIIFIAVLIAATALIVPYFAGAKTEQILIAKRDHSEKYYQQLTCEMFDDGEAIMEYRLPDGTRVDCLTEDFAIEHDFADKWAESIGQCLYYAAMTGKRPGIILIMEDPLKDQKYLNRVLETISYHNLDITVWQAVKGADGVVLMTDLYCLLGGD